LSAVRFAAVLALAFFSAGVLAQLAQVRPDAGSVLEQMKPPPAAPAPGANLLPRVAEPKPALGAPGLKVNVTAFRISGNTIYPEDVLAATVREFVGKEQNIDGLNDAAARLRSISRRARATARA
jgi:hemolysin activation/secretion protein